MRISDWSSVVCSSDLPLQRRPFPMVINSDGVSLSERHEGLFRDENCSLQQLILRPDQNAVVVALFSRRPAIFDISAVVVKRGLLSVNFQRDTIHGGLVALFDRIET